MKRKLFSQFMINYLMIFLLTLLVTLLAFVLLSFASSLISGSLAKSRYPASAIIKEDYSQIDASDVVQSGGGYKLLIRNTVLFLRTALIPSAKTS